MRLPVTLLAAGGLFVTAGCLNGSGPETGSTTETVRIELNSDDVCAVRKQNPLDCCEPPPGESSPSGNRDPAPQSDTAVE
ncbi:MAG: hypothetical protein VB858_08090 [Planctomycetaceae bacterium]